MDKSDFSTMEDIGLQLLEATKAYLAMGYSFDEAYDLAFDEVFLTDMEV